MMFPAIFNFIYILFFPINIQSVDDEVEEHSFRNLMLMGVAIGLISSIIFHILTKDTGNLKREVFLNIVNKLLNYSIETCFLIKSLFIYFKEVSDVGKDSSFYRRRLSTISIASIPRRMSTFELVAIPAIGATDLNESDEAKMKPSDWLNDCQYYLIGLCYMSSRLIYMISIAYVVYYVEFTLLLDKKFNAIAPLVMFTSGFVMVWIVSICKKRISLDIFFVVSCILGLGKHLNTFSLL